MTAEWLPKLAREWFLITRALGTSGPYHHEEDVLRDASQWSRYLLYRRWVLRGPCKLVEVKGDWPLPTVEEAMASAKAPPVPENGGE